MNSEYDLLPWFIDCRGICLERRPRFYWISWEVQGWEGVELLRIQWEVAISWAGGLESHC